MEQKLEAAKLYNELKRTQPLIDGLKKKNMEMEKQIEELRLDKQEDRIKQSTATMMLKTEIRRLYADRRLVDQGRIQDERALNVVERKQALTKDMVTQLKEELLAMKKENFELKVLAEKMKKRYHEAQAQARKLAEVAGRNVGDLATKIGNTIPPKVGTLGNKPPAWASLASTPGGPSQHARIPPPSLRATKSTLIEPELPKPELDDVPDFEAWRLKIDTLTTERDFLSNECCMLKTRGNELSTKIAILERASNEAQARIKALELDQKTQTSSYKTMQLKCNKASKIAASIEKQFKDAKPNAKIDYSLLVESEPSTQLLAALLSAPTEQMRASSTNPDNAFRR
ncbi:uncharacterized protein BJ171DRAFT_163090 [Polychytrium aggregatum]|uniref:uncharacterized protein n=1 Tax=Polychytrium aggregatum TaxID=110093 RepID=UPI0022FEF76E|nr:uncharacterized protein BJ171DRAFT_163090 [Polychytrium aggregatum]KAI9202874.1 hypothetical protein BJ171DRAFT_163090 [Polychytrium aggregatum]